MSNLSGVYFYETYPYSKLIKFGQSKNLDYRLLVEERQEQTHSGIYNDILIVMCDKQYLNEFENTIKNILKCDGKKIRFPDSRISKRKELRLFTKSKYIDDKKNIIIDTLKKKEGFTKIITSVDDIYPSIKTLPIFLTKTEHFQKIKKNYIIMPSKLSVNHRTNYFIDKCILLQDFVVCKNKKTCVNSKYQFFSKGKKYRICDLKYDIEKNMISLKEINYRQHRLLSVYGKDSEFLEFE